MHWHEQLICLKKFDCKDIAYIIYDVEKHEFVLVTCAVQYTLISSVAKSIIYLNYSWWKKMPVPIN